MYQNDAPARLSIKACGCPGSVFCLTEFLFVLEKVGSLEISEGVW